MHKYKILHGSFSSLRLVCMVLHLCLRDYRSRPLLWHFSSLRGTRWYEALRVGGRVWGVGTQRNTACELLNDKTHSQTKAPAEEISTDDFAILQPRSQREDWLMFSLISSYRVNIPSNITSRGGNSCSRVRLASWHYCITNHDTKSTRWCKPNMNILDLS